MIQIEAFQEFRAGLAFLRGGDAHRALPHLRAALDQEPANPFYISYVGVAIAAAEQKWAEAEKLCHSAMRMNRRQAQLYLNLAEVYVAADRKQDAADILARGLHYAPHDLRLKLALDRLAMRSASRASVPSPDACHQPAIWAGCDITHCRFWLRSNLRGCRLDVGRGSYDDTRDCTRIRTAVSSNPNETCSWIVCVSSGPDLSSLWKPARPSHQTRTII